MSDANSLVEAIEARQQYEPAPEPYADTEDTSVVEGAWSIQNIQTCEWALKRAANLSMERQEILEAAAAAKARIDARAAELTAKLDRGLAFFEAHIAGYACAHRDELLGGGKRKSRTFLYGTVGWRGSAARLVVTDETALTDWLVDNADPALFRAKVEPQMKALQDLHKQKGVIPPGTEVKPESEKLYIDPVDPAGPLKKGTP